MIQCSLMYQLMNTKSIFPLTRLGILGIAALLVGFGKSQAQEVSQGEDGSQWNMNVPYIENQHRQHERHRLNLVIPPRKDGKKLPLVIWIHGGAFWTGSKDDKHLARALFDKGFAVCSINYRLSNSAPFPAQLQDCKAAIRWLRKHADQYGIDPDRIGVWGASAGGYLSAMLAVTGGVKQFEWGENLDQGSRVQCAVDWFGPTNFLLMDQQARDIPGADRNHDDADSPESLLIGGPIQEHQDKVKRADPCQYASKDDSPILIVHGKKDRLVPFGQSELLVKALRDVRAPVEFTPLDNAGHGEGFGEAEHKAAEDFLIKHLKP